MRTDLDPDHVDRYRRDGFLIVGGLLDAGELEAWRKAVDAAVAERGDVAIAGMKPPDPARLDDSTRKRRSFYSTVFTQRVNLWQTNDRMRELVLDRAIGKLASELEGIDGIRIWHDQALIKEAWASPTAFHLDVPYWSFTSEHAITIWIALDDATLENGCLCYVPGSHLARKFDNVGIGPEIGALFDVYPEWRETRPVFCPVKAGGAIFHNGLSAHGACANMTPGRRRAMTIQFMPDGSTFNGTRNILPQEYFASLKVGDTLDNDDQNPLVYSG